MTPLGSELPSPAALLFNHPIRGTLPIISRPPVGVNNDEEHHEVLVDKETKDDKNQGTPINYVSIPTGFTVVVQHEDGGLWTHGTVEGKGDHNHHEISYNIHISKTGELVNKDRKHIQPAQITSEQYLQDQLQKHTTSDLREDILKQLEKQPHTSNTHTVNNRPCTTNQTHKCISPSKGLDNKQGSKLSK